ncbi:hypothetical protein N8340_09295 [Flavobacteriaceae bacterium]|nr:hypothetical protein [Flavobacteriaceae bacterium]
MKKIFIVFLLISILTPKNIYSQKGQGIAAAAGIVAGIAGAAIATEQLKEELELFATNFILKEFDLNAFELKIDGLGDQAKASDPSTISILSFNVTPVDFNYGSPLNEGKFSLLVFFDSGWRNEFGIDITKVKFKEYYKTEWNNLLGTYISLASGVEIKDGKVPVYKKANGEFLFSGDYIDFKYIQIENNGIRNSNNTILNFKKLNGDTYLVDNFSDEYKLIYNEKSLGLFLKENQKLVQINKRLMNRITDFLNL